MDTKSTDHRLTPTTRIFVAGHSGLVGAALCRRLRALGCENIITRDRAVCDLTNQSAVEKLFAEEQPEYVFLAAAKVGGILANQNAPAEFIYSNLAIQTHVIQQCYAQRARRLLFLGSSCVYPRACPQPIREESLLNGLLEPTNEAYAIAKIAGAKMCHYYNAQYGTEFLAVMPTNVYGPGDNFHLEHAHVVPATMRKIHEAKLLSAPHVTIWGSGTPRRELMYVDDMAEACVFLMQGAWPGNQHVNIGTGVDVSIRELAETLCEIIDYRGELIFDPTKPDGMPVKRLDVSRLEKLGWRATTNLQAGLRQTYAWFVENQDQYRRC